MYSRQFLCFSCRYVNIEQPTQWGGRQSCHGWMSLQWEIQVFDFSPLTSVSFSPCLPIFISPYLPVRLGHKTEFQSANKLGKDHFFAGCLQSRHSALADSPVTPVCQQRQREEVVSERRLELLSGDRLWRNLRGHFSRHQRWQNWGFHCNLKEAADERWWLVLVFCRTAEDRRAGVGHAATHDQ